MAKKVPAVTISYSELQSLRRCQFKHHIEYVQGWKKEHGPESALGFGTAWHEVLNAYYGYLAKGWRSYEQSAWREALHVVQQQPEEIQEPLRWMLDGYAARYADEPGWHVMGVERKLIVRLPQLHPGLNINLKVKIDLVIKDRSGKIWIDDHKTAARLPTANSYRDPQLPLYMWAWNQRYPNSPVHGVRYSYSLKPGKRKRPLEDEWDKRFRRTPITYTDTELETIAWDAYRTAFKAYWRDELWIPDPPPRSLSPDCSWCDFKDACRLNLRGRDLTHALTDYGFSRWREEPKVPSTEEPEPDAQEEE